MRTRLQAISEEAVPTLLGTTEEVPLPEPKRPAPIQDALTGLLITSLKALSQRTIIALSSLVDLALLASVFVLWLEVIANPTTLQLSALGGYAVFVLIALFLRRNS